MHPAPSPAPGPSARADADAADLRALLDAQDRAVVVLSPDNLVLFSNARARAWFGSERALEGQPCPVPTHDDDADTLEMTSPSGAPLVLQRTSATFRWSGRPARMVTWHDSAALRRAEERLQRLGRLHTALAQIAAVLARAADDDDALAHACRLAAAAAGFRAVVVAMARPDAPHPTPVAWAGVPVLGGSTEAPIAPEGWRLGPVEQALRLAVPAICDLVAADPQLAAWEADARQLGVASIAACPILGAAGVQGVLAFYAGAPGAFDRELVGIVTQITAMVAEACERIAARDERRQAEAHRREVELQLSRFRSLVESAGDAFYILDPGDRFRVIYMYDAGVRHFGWSREELGDMSPWQWDPHFTPESTRALWENVRERGSTVFETSTRTRDGQLIRVEVVSHYLRTPEGEFLAGYFRDITARAAAEAELRASGERLQEQAHLLDEATDAIIVCDAAGQIQRWNRGAERLLGWSREDAVGRHADTLHFADPSQFALLVAAAGESGSWNGEIAYRTRDGSHVLVESRWTVRTGADGGVRAVLTINTDITERRRRESVRLRAQRLESIGALAGGIAHDLNNILAPVVLSSDILRLRIQDPADLELIGAIGTSARRGAEIVRQILSFARGAEGTHIPINIRHLLPEIRHIVLETFPRSIHCRVEAAHDLWSILGEPTQLHQVLLNLCLNARDAMPGGGVLTLRADNFHVDAALAAGCPGAHAGSHVRIQVIDTGCGIPDDVRARIFEPFFTTKGPGCGTGLGLPTAMAIVRTHRGFITVESAPGRGTTIAAHFPAEQPAGTSAVAPEATLARLPAEPPGRGELILVIDDEASVRSITRQCLETAGYRVITAEDGSRGVSVFQEHRSEVALVLTDMLMPAMDGIAVIKALRRIAPGARIVAVSGATEAATLAQISPSPAVGFLLKPFNLDSLLRVVHEALSSPSVP